VEKGNFREDLYYRLNVIRLDMPPLRDRKADLPLLSNYFMKEVCVKNNITEKTISEAALEKLMEYSWPGNIRELRNVMEEAVVISGGKIIEPDNLNLSYYRATDKNQASGMQEDMPLHELEKKSIINALIKTKGNQTRAAKLLGISRKMIMKKIEKHGISSIVPVRTRISKKA
jgi:DNA-binding NtrC family response regulator